jgi:molybdopterin-guanine dinucleotide biosynthesis protein A
VRLLVVGEPGSGKTSWCRCYVNSNRENGARVGGVLCPAIQEQRRAGSDAIDLLTGEKVPFARLSARGSFRGGEEVGDFTISGHGISFACAAIERALADSCDLVVIDEVGPLELSGKGLMPAVELALTSPVNVLLVVRRQLREALERRFPECEFVVAADLAQSPAGVSHFTDGESREVTGFASPSEGCRPEKAE